MNLLKTFYRSPVATLATWLLLLIVAVLSGTAVADASVTATAHRATGGFTVTSLLVAGMIINVQNIQGLTTGFKTLFNGAFQAAESFWNRVATEVPSGTKTETYAWLGMSTRFKEWLGERVVQNLGQHGFSITNKDFENTVGVKRSDIEDDTYGVYSPLFKQLGYDAAVHPDELVFDLLKNAHQTLGYDGQNFFDTDHPVVDAAGAVQNVANYVTGAGPLWALIDTSKPIKPLILQRRKPYTFTAMDKDTDDNVFRRNEYLYGADGRLNVGVGLWQLAHGSRAVLTAANYKLARAAMRNFTADGGKKLNIMPKLLVVGPTLEGEANALVKAQKDAAGADNIWHGTADVVVVPWLE
ncbi:MAG: Mu-like prophage major head subunit gpT family protein [Gemmatimonadaceae bacterium]